MTPLQEKMLTLTDEAIDLINSLLARGEDEEKIRVLINRIEIPEIRRLVMLQTGLL